MVGITYRNTYEKVRGWLNGHAGDRRLLYIGLFVLAAAIVLAIAAAVSAIGTRSEAAAESTVPAANENNDTTSQVTGGQGTMKTELKINGENVEVPQEGHVRKEINSDSGNVQVDLDVSSQESGDTRSSSSVNIHVQSSSSSELRSE